MNFYCGGFGRDRAAGVGHWEMGIGNWAWVFLMMHNDSGRGMMHGHEGHNGLHGMHGDHGLGDNRMQDLDGRRMMHHMPAKQVRD